MFVLQLGEAHFQRRQHAEQARPRYQDSQPLTYNLDYDS